MRIAAVSVGVAALVLLVLGVFFLQKRLTMIRTWRPVMAQVTKATLAEQSGPESTSYSADYELSYIVDGKTLHTSARSNDSLGTPEAKQQRIARHAPGSQGLIHVNPDDASQIRLNLGNNAVTLALPLWMLLCAGSLLLFAISFWLMGTPKAGW